MKAEDLPDNLHNYFKLLDKYFIKKCGKKALLHIYVQGPPFVLG